MKNTLILLITLIMIGCSRPAAYSFFIAINDRGWENSEHAIFSVDTLPQVGTYACTLLLRTMKATPYPYKDFYAEIKFTQNDSVVIATDTIQIQLCNEQSPENAAGISMHTHSLKLRNVNYVPSQSHQITVRHLMQQSPLPGIIAVGIELTPTSNEN